MSVVRPYRIAGALVLGASLLFSMFPALAQGTAVKIGDISVVDAWARATPAKAGGVFITLRNDGAVADRLVGVSSDAAQMAHLHESKQENGVMEMRPIDGVDIPPHATVALKPGGTHIMLMGLAKPLTVGESFPLTLTFAKAGAATVTVMVKAAGATDAGQ